MEITVVGGGHYPITTVATIFAWGNDIDIKIESEVEREYLQLGRYGAYKLACALVKAKEHIDQNIRFFKANGHKRVPDCEFNKRYNAPWVKEWEEDYYGRD